MRPTRASRRSALRPRRLPKGSEGELVGIAGAPDLLSRERGSKTYTYLPIVGDPFTTTIVLVSGRVREIERVRQF